MNAAPARQPSAISWIGLFIALFGLLIVRWAVTLFYPPFGFAGMAWKEALNWCCVVALLVIIRWGENLPFSSVGFGKESMFRSIAWAVLLTVACFVVGGVISTVTRFKGGEMVAALTRLPLWLALLVVVRAGLAEELFYRGYAIERLEAMGLNKYCAGGIPLLIFGGAHWTNGWPNVCVALGVGAVLTLFYLWRRNLFVNIVGHFLVDFISVIVPRLLIHR